MRGSNVHHAFVLGALLLAAVARGQGPAPRPAAEILVTTPADSGPGSLREALRRANSERRPWVIRFDSKRGPFATPQTIALKSELPPIEGEVTIDGYIPERLWEPNGVTLSGANARRVFQVAPSGRAVISSLTIADGKAERGGGILNRGTLLVKNVTFHRNSAARDGGALANDGSLTVINSTFVENEAGESGGGVAHLSGSASITQGTFARNRARSGGGLFSRSAVLVRNTILAHSKSADCVAQAGVDPRSTHNLIMQNEGCGQPLLSADPMLEPLGLFNGPTATIPLMGGSPAINMGDNASAVDEHGKPLQWDQRGNGDPRFVAGFTDIGAFEVQAFPVLRVNTLEDNGLRGCSGVGRGDCSLRGAIELAQTDDKPKVITFDPQIFRSMKTITLKDRLPEVQNDLTLDAGEVGGITVRAAPPKTRGRGRLTLQKVVFKKP